MTRGGYWLVGTVRHLESLKKVQGINQHFKENQVSYIYKK